MNISENKNRKKVDGSAFISIPLSFLKNGDRGFIQPSYVLFVIKGGTSMDDIEIQRVILKDIGVCQFFVEGYVVIEKIGDGDRGEDYKLTFPQATSFAPKPMSSIKDKDKYTNPVDADCIVRTESNSLDNIIDYSKCTYMELEYYLNECFSAFNYNLVYDKVDKIISCFYDIAFEYYKDADDAVLYEKLSDVEKTVEENDKKRNDPDDETDIYSEDEHIKAINQIKIEVFSDVLDIKETERLNSLSISQLNEEISAALKETDKDLLEILNKIKETKLSSNADDLSPIELEEEMSIAAKQGNFERANQFKLILKKKKVPQEK